MLSQASGRLGRSLLRTVSVQVCGHLSRCPTCHGAPAQSAVRFYSSMSCMIHDASRRGVVPPFVVESWGVGLVS
jgi:hypothetical protein